MQTESELSHECLKAASCSLQPGTKFSLAFACLMGLLAVSATNTIIDLDLFHQMALFREYARGGVMPMHDVFAYTPTRDVVVHHEWGMGAIQYFAMETTGLGNFGLICLKYMLTFAIGFVCFQVAKRNGASFPMIALLTPVALSVGGYIGFTNVRAQVVTLLFVAIQFLMFTSDRGGKRLWCFAWVPMMIAWTNIHGGVIAGAAIFAFWAGCRFVEAISSSGFGKATREGAHRIGLTLSIPFLMCINPYGVAYVPYLIRAVSMKRPMIGEWSSIWGSSDVTMLLMFVFAIVLAGSAAFAIGKKQQRAGNLLKLLFPVCVIGLTWLMAAKNMRHVSIFAVAWFCYAPMLLAKTDLNLWIHESFSRNQPLIRKACVGASMLALAIALNAKFWAVSVPAYAEDAAPGSPIYPVHAINFLQENEIGGNMMVWFNDGAYVSWRMYPDVKVSLDSRYEVAYPHGAVEESVAFFNAEDSWRTTLVKYPTDLVLAPSGTAICDAMNRSIEEGSLNWERIYQDNGFIIFARMSQLTLSRKVN